MVDDFHLNHSTPEAMKFKFNNTINLIFFFTSTYIHTVLWTKPERGKDHKRTPGPITWLGSDGQDKNKKT